MHLPEPPIAVFLIGTLVAAFVVGVSGFAFGFAAAAIWLQALTPEQTAALIAIYAIVVQSYATWKLRRSIVPTRVLPFVAGTAIGILPGVLLLRWLSAGQMKQGIAAMLIAFSLYNLNRPKMPSVAWTGKAGDSAVGVINGILGGATGLGGTLPAIWSSMRGWTPDEQRAVFQPAAGATFLMCLPIFGSTGILTTETVRLAAIGMPCLLIGTIGGWSIYRTLDELAFRTVVLWLLLASGLTLLMTNR